MGTSFHCLLNDYMSLGTLVVVYAAMVLGNVLFCFSVIGPVIMGSQEANAGTVFEMIIFQSLWLMMLWSHTYTMCSEPGYIPFNYEYDRARLPEPYKQLFVAEN